jgi:hypothetical protein
MTRHVAINRDLTVVVPDSDEVSRIIEYYRGGIVNFTDNENRYIWLYKVMHIHVVDIEASRASR